MRLECVVLYNESQIVVVISSSGAYARGEKRLKESAKFPNAHWLGSSGMLEKRFRTEASDSKSGKTIIPVDALVFH